jgi:hypothetical protein
MVTFLFLAIGQARPGNGFLVSFYEGNMCNMLPFLLIVVITIILSMYIVL